MKKLLKKSTLALIMLSLFAVSCKKADVPVPPAVAADEVKSTWTPAGSAKPIAGKGDIKNGDIDVDYKLVPTLVAPPCPKGIGAWSVTLVAPAGAQYVMGYSVKTGETTFHPLTKGTYKLTFTYTCPGCKAVSLTITIIVS